jgi:hypothetical protein
MIDPQTLYSQTPGAYHMGMGYAGVGGVQDAFGGTMFGTGTLGTNAMIGARQLIGYTPALLTAMAGLSHMGMFPNGMMGGLFGAAGQLTRFGGLPLLALQAGAGAMQRGADSVIYAGQAMSRVFGERDAGGRLGLGASRSAAADYGRVFRDLSTSAEMLTNDAELKSIMTKMTDMQLLTTSRSASDMTGRFKKMVETMRDMSIDIGTTLDGVMPIFQRHLQMGFLSARDIHMSARHGRGVAGVGIGNTQENVQVFQGTQSAVARAHGGRGDLAARHAADVLGLVQYQMLDQDFDMPTRLQHAGLGVGRDGAMAFAEHFMEGTSALMQKTELGSAVMAVLGAKQDNRFIGGIDASQLARLRSGKITDIIAEAASRTQGQDAILSFEAQRRSGLGADIQSQMGMGDMVNVLNSILSAHGMNDSEQKLILLQSLTGQTGRVSKLMLDFVERTTESVVGDYEKQLAEVTVRNTLAGNTAARFSIDSQLGRASRDISNMYGFRLLRNLGADLVTGVGDYADNISDQWWQRGVWGAVGGVFGHGFDGQRRGINTRTRNSEAYKRVLEKELNARTAPQALLASDSSNADMSTWKDYMGDDELDRWMLSDETAGSRTARNVSSAVVGTAAGVVVGAKTFGGVAALKGALVVAGAAAGAVALTVGAAVLTGYLAYSMFDDPQETLQSAADRYEAARSRLTEQLNAAVEANQITAEDKDNKLAQLKRAYDRKVSAIRLGITGKTLLEQQETISKNIGEHLQRNDMMGGADLEFFGGDIQSSFLYELYQQRDYGALSAVAGVLGDERGADNKTLRNKALAGDPVLDAHVRERFGITLNDQSRDDLRKLLRLDAKQLAARLKKNQTKEYADLMLRTQAQAQLQSVYDMFGTVESGNTNADRLKKTLDTLARTDSNELPGALTARGVTQENLPRIVDMVTSYRRALSQSSDQAEAFAIAIQGLVDPISTPAGQLNAAKSSAEDNLKTAQVLAEVTQGMGNITKAISGIQTVQAQERAFFAEFSKQLLDRLKD